MVEGGPEGLVMATHATLPLDLWRIENDGVTEEEEEQELRYVSRLSLPPSLPSFLLISVHMASLTLPISLPPSLPPFHSFDIFLAAALNASFPLLPSHLPPTHPPYYPWEGGKEEWKKWWWGRRGRVAFASPFSGNGSYADFVEKGTIALKVGRGGREGGREGGGGLV